MFVLDVLGDITFPLECTHVRSSNKLNLGYVLFF
jgi:hypothetical protein